MPFCKQFIDRRLANWRKSDIWVGGHFNPWLVLPEMTVMQIGQLVADLSDRFNVVWMAA